MNTAPEPAVAASASGSSAPVIALNNRWNSVAAYRSDGVAAESQTIFHEVIVVGVMFPRSAAVAVHTANAKVNTLIRISISQVNLQPIGISEAARSPGSSCFVRHLATVNHRIIWH